MNESGDSPSVGAFMADPRAIRIEQPQDARIEVVRSPIRHTERFAVALALIVTTAWADRVYASPVGLGRWDDFLLKLNRVDPTSRIGEFLNSIGEID